MRVTGAKVVATGSALTHFTFVAHAGLYPVQDKNFAMVFLVPTNANGVKLICRVSNEQRAAVIGSPFDYPLSSRLDENDAIFIMDDVLVPWENVFVYGDIEKANKFFPRSGFCRAPCCRAAPGSRSSSISSPAYWSRRQKSPVRAGFAASKPTSVRSSPGGTRCGAFPTRWPRAPSRGPAAAFCRRRTGNGLPRPGAGGICAGQAP